MTQVKFRARFPQSPSALRSLATRLYNLWLKPERIGHEWNGRLSGPDTFLRRIKTDPPIGGSVADSGRQDHAFAGGDRARTDVDGRGGDLVHHRIGVAGIVV